jgi:hypothetical protein
MYKIPIYNPSYMNFNVKWSYEEDGTMYVSVPLRKIVFDGYPWESKTVEDFHLNTLCDGLRLDFDAGMEIIERLVEHKHSGDCSFEPIYSNNDSEELSG